VRISLLLLAGVLTLAGTTTESRAGSALDASSSGSGTSFAGDAAVLPPSLGSTASEHAEDLDPPIRAVPRSRTPGVGWARPAWGATAGAEPDAEPYAAGVGVEPSGDPFADFTPPIGGDALEIFDRRPFPRDFAPLESTPESFDLFR
jgi:hypothetical protein